MKSQQNGTNLPAYDGSGNASLPSLAGFVTLDADVHYFPIPAAGDGEIQSIQIITDGTIAGDFKVETCNLPPRIAEVGQVDTSDYDETVGRWVQENPTSAYVASVGTGWSITALELTKTAAAGGAMIHLGNLGSRRLRLRANITTGGTMRVVPHGKA